MLRRILKKPHNSILLLGPRGTGKSTWIKQVMPDAPSYDLLNSKEALRLARAPGIIFDELKILKPGTWVVIDEIQKVPALMDEVHRLIENHGLCFILSGSSVRKLKSHGTNLLAGRAILTPFFPLVSAELGKISYAKEAYIYGMLPKVITSERPHAFWRLLHVKMVR